MKNYGTLYGSCSFELPTHILPLAISPTHSASSYLPLRRYGKKWRFEKSLKFVSETFLKLFLSFLIQLITVEYIISGPIISRLF
jgi:hypothetical protein